MGLRHMRNDADKAHICGICPKICGYAPVRNVLHGCASANFGAWPSLVPIHIKQCEHISWCDLSSPSVEHDCRAQMVKDSGGKPASKVALVYSPLLSGSPSFSAEKSRNFSDFETNLGTAQCSHLLLLSMVKHQTPSRSLFGFLFGIQMGITAAVVSVCWLVLCCGWPIFFIALQWLCSPTSV